MFTLPFRRMTLPFRRSFYRFADHSTVVPKRCQAELLFNSTTDLTATHVVGIGSDVFPGPNLMCFTLRRGVLHLNLPFLHTFLNIETCENFSEK